MKRYLEGIVAGSALLGLLALPAAAQSDWFSALSESEQLTAVNSKQFNGYQRTRLADGSYAPETFAFGDGKEVVMPTNFMAYHVDDATMRLGFNQLAHDLSGPLAQENYISAAQPASTRLLVMVYWGRTITGNLASGSASRGAGHMDTLTADWNDFENARLLGFEKEAAVIGETEGDSFTGQMMRTLHSAIFSQLEVDRYFVILRAYDFQAAWRRHKMTLLWETRFSLSERHRDFREDVTSMAMSAAPYFGQDTYGLATTPLVREGRVEIGDVKLIDYVSPGAGQVRALQGLTGTWQGATSHSSAVVLRIDPDGGATFLLPRRGEKAAHVFLAGSSVTVTVPGWDVQFEGRLSGDSIQGSLSEYRSSAKVTLERER